MSGVVAAASDVQGRDGSAVALVVVAGQSAGTAPEAVEDARWLHPTSVTVDETLPLAAAVGVAAEHCSGTLMMRQEEGIAFAAS